MSAGWFDVYKMNEDQPQLQVEKQGIVSILNTSSDFNSSHNSIRRTLSADFMSSPKWLHNNGFSHHSSSLKRVKSSLHLQQQQHSYNNHATNNDDTDQGPAFEDIWSSIQADNKSCPSILSNDGSPLAPAPYVHPLAKRTASSLSEKSLEICTESLGSETGSDRFSYPPSDSDDDVVLVEEQDQEQVGILHNAQHVGVVINNNRVVVPTSNKSVMVPPTRPSFPPPLPSLGHRDDGSNLHIRSHRQDGRLVVQAVSVPSQNCFLAKRQDGRLLLTFTEATTTDHDDDYDDAETEHNIEKNNVQVEQQNVMDDNNDDEKGVVNNLQRSCTTLAMMTKFMELTNKSTTWPRNYNTTVIKSSLNKDLNHNHNHKDKFQREFTLGVPKTQSLPPRPTKSNTATALNAYEYYWRRNSSTTVGMLKPLANCNNNNNNNNNIGVQNNKRAGEKHTTKKNNNKLLYAAHSVKKEAALTPQNQHQHQQQDVSTATAAEYVMPLMLRGCKEAKKPSLLLWEPYCIATS